MTDFTNIRNAIANLVSAVEDAANDLVTTANTQRVELIALYNRMRETNKDLCEFGSIVGDAGAALLDISELCEDVAVKAPAAIEIGADRLPECNYEDLDDFCDECGRAIVNGDDATITDEGLILCADCHPITDELDT